MRTHGGIYKLLGNGNNIISHDFRKLSLWMPGEEDSLIVRGISEDGGEKRHC